MSAHLGEWFPTRATRMSSAQQYDFDSINAEDLIDNPELPEMFASLLKLYRMKCQSEARGNRKRSSR